MVDVLCLDYLLIIESLPNSGYLTQFWHRTSVSRASHSPPSYTLREGLAHETVSQMIAINRRDSRTFRLSEARPLAHLSTIPARSTEPRLAEAAPPINNGVAIVQSSNGHVGGRDRNACLLTQHQAYDTR